MSEIDLLLVDANDPKHVAELQWMGAITHWMNGGKEHDPEPLIELIRKLEIPDDAKNFLSDVVAGAVKKGSGGRPRKYYPPFERRIVANVFAEWEKTKTSATRKKGQSPKVHAIEAVAQQSELTDDAVRGIVDRVMNGSDWTVAKWVKWGRPTF